VAGDDDQTIYGFTGATPEAFLDPDIESARRSPAVAPFTVLTVRLSMPAAAPQAAFDAAYSMLDRPVSMLLIEAFAVATSTSTTAVGCDRACLAIQGSRSPILAPPAPIPPWSYLSPRARCFRSVPARRNRANMLKIPRF
jgi:hypothetical protein